MLLGPAGVLLVAGDAEAAAVAVCELGFEPSTKAAVLDSQPLLVAVPFCLVVACSTAEQTSVAVLAWCACVEMLPWSMLHLKACTRMSCNTKACLYRYPPTCRQAGCACTDL